MVLKSKSVLSGSKQMVRSRSSDNLPTSQSQVNVQMMSHTLTIREVSTPEPSEVVEVQYFPHRFSLFFCSLVEVYWHWHRLADGWRFIPNNNILTLLENFSPVAAPAAMSWTIIFLPDSSPASRRTCHKSFIFIILRFCTKKKVVYFLSFCFLLFFLILGISVICTFASVVISRPVRRNCTMTRTNII